MSEHTPTPFAYRLDGKDPSWPTWYRITSANGTLVALCDKEAKAAFILRAANAHAALLGALQDIADQLVVYDDNRVIPDEVAVKLIRKIKDRARAAIKLAEGNDA